MPLYEVVVNLGTLVVHVEADDEIQAEENAIEQLSNSQWQSDVDLEAQSVTFLED